MKWNIVLIFAIMQFNNRIIYYFEMNFNIIFLKIFFNLTAVDFVLFHVFNQIIQFWFTEIFDSKFHSIFLFRYLTYRIQIRNHIKQFLNEKKNVFRYNKKIFKSVFISKNMIFLY